MSEILQIPVTKAKDGNYVIVIAPSVWNGFQKMIIDGAEAKGLVIEFILKEEQIV